MKTYKILKGWHYSNFIPSIKLIDDTMIFEKEFVFDESCKYEVDEPSCVNKLFGFCFGFGVHKDSFRFGWTYDKDSDLYSIWKYEYYHGKLSKYVIKSFSAKDTSPHKFKIIVVRSTPSFGIYRHIYSISASVDNVQMYPCRLDSPILFITTLGPYFGGNSRAPHTIKIIQS